MSEFNRQHSRILKFSDSWI